MKPLKLELQAFGPFIQKQTVDFEKLSAGGIFLITGKTGSGKTTIFDAMTFALYGEASGNKIESAGRNSLADCRNTLAGDDIDTFVKFTFSVHGKVYRFERLLLKKRKNLVEDYGVFEIHPDGSETPLPESAKSKEITATAERLVGLDKDQFVRVMLLPQGQFEQFLVARTGEKEEILRKIFGTEKWSAYAAKFFDRAKERYDVLQEEQRKISNLLEEERISNIGQLDSLIKSIEQMKTDLASEEKEYGADVKAKALDADIALSKEFEPLHDAEKEISELRAEFDETEKLRAEYSEAESAEKLRAPLEACRTARDELKLRTENLKTLEERIPDFEKAAAEAAEAFSEKEKNSPVSGLQKRIGEYSGKRAGYERMASLVKEMERAKNEYETVCGSVKKLQETLDIRTADAALAKKKSDAAGEKAKDLRDRYYAGIYGELASGLSDGEKCPVCGSTVHPEPAEKAPDSVTKADMDTAQNEADKAEKIWNNAEKVRAEEDERLRKAQTELNEKNAVYRETATAYESARAGLIDGIADSDALERAIKDAEDRIKKFNEESVLLKSLAESSKEALASVRAETETARGEKISAEKKLTEISSMLNTMLSDSGYADYVCAEAVLKSADERSAMHEKIVKYDTSVSGAEQRFKTAQANLAGKTEPDASLFEERRREIDGKRKEFASRAAKLESDTERLNKKMKDISELQKHYDDNITQASDDLTFARRLKGDSGVGIETYVLAVMFDRVIFEANRMLGLVHGGRYRLFRTDEGSGRARKKGLDLKAYDSYSPGHEGRDVGSLSGGEKFLVSLALSIGISTVARQSGVETEALFIDEGFGTLDDQSIEDALTVLEHVRSGSGTIGIISHVSLLEDNIPTKLTVENRMIIQE